MSKTLRYLTEHELAALDPHGRARRALSARFPEKRTLGNPSPCLLENKTPDEIRERYFKVFSDRPVKHAPIWEYDVEMASKFGPQGGRYPRTRLIELLDEAYANVDLPRTTSPILDDGLYSLLTEIRQLVSLVGKPAVSHKWMVKNSSGGLPTMCRKNTWQAHVTGRRYWLHPYPDVPNTRVQRGKDRLTHEDATVNIDYVMPYLTAVRQWLTVNLPQYFGVWANPCKHTHPIATSALLRRWWSLETDFKGMDLHYSLFVLEHYVLPVYELLLDEAEYWHFAAFVRELFFQPTFLGDILIEGEHTLFSGQSITQDVETIFDVVLYIGASLHAAVPRSLWTMIAVGDDVAFFTKREKDAENIYSYVKEATNAVGLVLEPTKTRLVQGNIHFCRSVYYPALPVKYNEDGLPYVDPAYPPILTLNSCVWPENPLAPNVEIVSILARMANLKGFYRQSDFCYFLFKYLDPSLEVTQEALDAVNERDWWRIVYGESVGFDWSSPVLNWWRCYVNSRK